MLTPLVQRLLHLRATTPRQRRNKASIGRIKSLFAIQILVQGKMIEGKQKLKTLAHMKQTKFNFEIIISLIQQFKGCDGNRIQKQNEKAKIIGII